MWHNYWNWTKKTRFIHFLFTILRLFFTDMKIYVYRCTFWSSSVVSDHYNTRYLFFNLLYGEKRSSNLKMSINFGRLLYLKELSYHTQIGRIWKSKTNSLIWDQSGYGSFIRLDFTVFQRWVNFLVIFLWFW